MVSYSLPEPRLLFHTQTHYCGNNYFIFYLWSLTGSVCHCGIHTPPHCWLSRLEVGCCEQHSWVCALRSAQTQHPGWGAVQHRRKEQGVSSSLAFLELVFKSLSGCSSLSEGLGEPDKGTQSKQVFSFLWLHHWASSPPLSLDSRYRVCAGYTVRCSGTPLKSRLVCTFCDVSRVMEMRAVVQVFLQPGSRMCGSLSFQVSMFSSDIQQGILE